jgi:hypothetical protein
MTSSDAARILGPMAALWPNLNAARREAVWQGLNIAERHAVWVLFGRENCPGLPPEPSQDEAKPVAESDYIAGDSFSEHRRRWQDVADAGQVEVKRKPQVKVEVERVTVTDNSERRKRWTEAAEASTRIPPSNNALSTPDTTPNLPIRRQVNRGGMGFWRRVETALVCLCMTPILYLLLAWLLWLVCSSQHYAQVY